MFSCACFLSSNCFFASSAFSACLESSIIFCLFSKSKFIALSTFVFLLLEVAKSINCLSIFCSCFSSFDNISVVKSISIFFTALISAARCSALFALRFAFDSSKFFTSANSFSITKLSFNCFVNWASSLILVSRNCLFWFSMMVSSSCALLRFSSSDNIAFAALTDISSSIFIITVFSLPLSFLTLVNVLLRPLFIFLSKS